MYSSRFADFLTMNACFAVSLSLGFSKFVIVLTWLPSKNILSSDAIEVANKAE